MFAEIINAYGAEIIGTLLLAMAGIFGMIVKNMVNKYLDTDTKRTLAKLVVQFVEQVYKDLNGVDKLREALSVLSDMLMEKKINATEMEMLVLIEAAVAEFNDAFKKPKDTENAKATYLVPEVDDGGEGK